MLGVAIQGAGNVSTEHIKAYEKNRETQVVAICSRTLEGAARKRNELGLDCAIYANYDAMLARSDVDIVSICTPPERHAEETIAAARAGKHIVIEKPVATNPQELAEMARAVTEVGVRTVVSFVLRWNPMVANMRQAIARGLVGRPFLIQTDYWHGPSNGPGYPHRAGSPRKPFSTFLGGGCHAVDMARYLMEDDIVSVSGVSPDTSGDPARTTVAVARFANGAVGKISASSQMFMPYVFNIEVFGDEGVLRNDRFYSRHFPGMEGFAAMPTTVPDSGAVSHHPFQCEIDHFAACIRQGVESHCNLADAVNTHQACFAAELSAARGGEPIRLPLEEDR